MNIAVIVNNKEELKKMDDYINSNYSSHPDVDFLSKYLPIVIGISEKDWSWAKQPEAKSPTYLWGIFGNEPADKIMTCDEFFGNTISSSNLLLVI